MEQIKLNCNELLVYCCKKILKKGTAFKTHCHNYVEFEIILNGEAEHIYNNTSAVISTGNAYIIPPQGFHSFSALSDITLYSICFDINVADKEIKNRLLSNINECFYCRFSLAETEEILSFSKALEKEQTQKSFLSDMVLRCLISFLCAQIIRKTDTMQKHENSIVSEMIHYMHNNFSSPILLTELAERFSVTPNYLGNLFFKQTGQKFNSYINEIRVKHACNLLMLSEEPVGKVALLSGYSSVEYFTYVFKKATGISPGNYRKEFKKAKG